MTIIVSAGSGLQHYGHFLAGIEPTVGPVDVTFTSQDLPAIRSTRDGMALVLADGNGRLRVRDYLEKTRRSLAAINTPAVHGCLGWKPGKFLALGKAIVTRPIAQVMPGAFDLERHVAVVDSADDVIDTHERLSHDHVERLRLETAARQYFLEEVAPDAAMARLVSVARQQPRGSDRMRP
jgi:hypothetical protein